MGDATVEVSLVIPAFNEEGMIRNTVALAAAFLRGTGFTYEIVVVDDGSADDTAAIVESLAAGDPAIRLIRLGRNEGKGAAVRRGMLDAEGEVIAFVDADLPYRMENLAEAIATVREGESEIAIGARDLAESEGDPSYPLSRRVLGRAFSHVVRLVLDTGVFDTQCGLKVFRRDAAMLLFGQARLTGFGFDFEILYLARKYGLTVRRIAVAMTHRHASKVRLLSDSVEMLRDLLRVRRNDRRGLYRPVRRCPVCFASQVRTLTQIRSWVIRECRSCRCRFIGRFPSEEELNELYNSDYFESDRDVERGYARRDLDEPARRTFRARLELIRRVAPTGSRVLEVGAGNGLFGRLASEEFDYVGIDLSKAATEEAREEGLAVYCAGLADFVNTGAPFDVVTLFHVFEHLPDPHDALARISGLLRPGGHVVIITPDTESLLCAVSGDRWVSYKLPEHLILYSRSALMELLERSGFEIVTARADFEFCDREFILSRLEQLNKPLSKLARLPLSVLPAPLPVTSGSTVILAKKRGGVPLDARSIKVVGAANAR